MSEFELARHRKVMAANMDAIDAKLRAATIHTAPRNTLQQQLRPKIGQCTAESAVPVRDKAQRDHYKARRNTTWLCGQGKGPPPCRANGPISEVYDEDATRRQRRLQ